MGAKSTRSAVSAGPSREERQLRDLAQKTTGASRTRRGLPSELWGTARPPLRSPRAQRAPTPPPPPAPCLPHAYPAAAAAGPLLVSA